MTNLKDLIDEDFREHPFREDSNTSKEYLEKAEDALRDDDLEAAIMFAETALRFDPKNTKVKIFLFQRYTLSGNRFYSDFSGDAIQGIEKSIEHYRKAIGIKPGDSSAKQKLDRAILDSEFQARIKKGDVTPPYFGVYSNPGHFLKRVQSYMSHANFSHDFWVTHGPLSNDRVNSHLRFLLGDATQTLSKQIRAYIDLKLYYLKKELSKEFNDANLDPISSSLINSKLELCEDGIRNLLKIDKTQVQHSAFELRPYKVDSTGAKDIYLWSPDLRDLDIEKLNELGNRGKVIRPKRMKSDNSRVYYYENYILQTKTRFKYHIEMPFEFTHGYRGQGFVEGSMGFDFGMELNGNLILNGVNGETLESEYTGAKLTYKDNDWQWKEKMRSGELVVKHTLMGGLLGLLISSLPAKCAVGCEAMFNPANPDPDEIGIAMVVGGTVLGGLIGYAWNALKDKGDISYIHHRKK